MSDLYSEKMLMLKDTAVYTENQVVFEKSAAGTYTADILDDGLYEIIAVGGGGGCEQTALEKLQYTTAVSSSGGSGAVVHGVFRLSKGSISVTVGALGKSANTTQAGRAGATNGGTTTVGNICSVGGGGAGTAAFDSPILHVGGSAGTVTSYNSTMLVNNILISNGNAGSSQWYNIGNKDGTASSSVVSSPYPPYGNGSGGTATTRYYLNVSASFTHTAGNAGYVKIIFKGK